MMRKLAILAAILSTLPLIANADETFIGKIIGYDCAHHGVSCAIDRLDPHLRLEQDFVLVQEGGGPICLLI